VLETDSAAAILIDEPRGYEVGEGSGPNEGEEGTEDIFTAKGHMQDHKLSFLGT
jgi:hypothetical protein